MKITFWGTRGSLPSPGPETNRFGGNTSCIAVSTEETLLILDAGSGIRRLGMGFDQTYSRIDILLSHLHMDHIQGLGFFEPLYKSGLDIHIWGPASTNQSLKDRLNRYLSPPLFPVRLRDLPCHLQLHELAEDTFEIGDLHIQSSYVCHPGPTIGFRISNGKHNMAYIPDHEPALGLNTFPNEENWTSGSRLAHEVDLLIHDAQYTTEEYASRIGWGHSSIIQTLEFAQLAQVKHLILFHHDPGHTDKDLQAMYDTAIADSHRPFTVSIAKEGSTFAFSSHS